MNSAKRLEADAWYTALRRWRLLHRSIYPGRVPGSGPNIRMVAGQYAQDTNAPTRRLESLVLTPVGALPTSRLVSAIRELPPEAQLVLDHVRMAPRKGLGALPTSRLVSAIRELPPEAQLVLDHVRMAPRKGLGALPPRLLRRRSVAYTGPKRLWTGYAAACLMLAEELGSRGY